MRGRFLLECLAESARRHMTIHDLESAASEKVGSSDASVQFRDIRLLG